MTLDTSLIHYSNLTLLASFHHKPKMIRRALEYIERGVVRAADFVDGECGLTNLPQLFKSMAGSGLLTSKQLAEKTGLNERYVLEWLRTMAAAGYLDYHPDSKAFNMPPEHVAVLADEESPIFCAGLIEATVPDMLMAPRVLAGFRSGKGLPELRQGVAAGHRRQ